jgi:hypothetical protein
MDEATKANLDEKQALLRQATQNPAIKLQEFQAAIDALQAALFAIGSRLYRESIAQDTIDMNIPESYTYADNSDDLDDVSDFDTDDFDGDLGLDATVTADYEAID